MNPSASSGRSNHANDSLKALGIITAIVVFAFFIFKFISNRDAGQSGMVAALACAPGVSPWIQVLSPNGGEMYTAGQQISVTWTSCNLSSAPVAISLFMLQPNGNNAGYILAGSTPNDGQQTVTLPAAMFGGIPMQYGKLFRIYIQSPYTYNGTTPIVDQSDALFTINASLGNLPIQTGTVSISPGAIQKVCTATTAPWIQVLSPNGGEMLTPSQKIVVTWKSCNILGNISEADLNYGTNGTTIFAIKDIPNNGSLSVTLPDSTSFTSNHISFGKYFTAQVIKLVNNTTIVQDYSDDTFTITPPIPAGCTSNPISPSFSTTTGMPCYFIPEDATSVTSTSATLNGYLFAGVPATVSFEKEPSGTVFSTKTQSTIGPSSAVITGLSPNTNYTFAICVQNQLNSGRLTCSQGAGFTTKP